MFCKHCGNEVEDSAAICVKCGKWLADAPPAMPAAKSAMAAAPAAEAGDFPACKVMNFINIIVVVLVIGLMIASGTKGVVVGSGYPGATVIMMNITVHYIALVLGGLLVTSTTISFILSLVKIHGFMTSSVKRVSVGMFIVSLVIFFCLMLVSFL